MKNENYTFSYKLGTKLIMINYNIISKYRTELMGLSIIWITFFHFSIKFSGHIIFYPLRFFKSIGYGGVDNFLFLSGFGLMYGMLNKKYLYTEFYTRRLIRILPSFWIITIFYYLLMLFIGKTPSLSYVLLNLSTIGFWLNIGQNSWYVPALVFFYLTFPVFFKFYIQRRNKKLFIIFVILSALSLCVITIFKANYLLIFVSRIPIFVLGAHFGYIAMKENSYITRNMVYFCIFLFIISVFLLMGITRIESEHLWYYGLWWYPFVLISPILCIFIPICLYKIDLLFKDRYFYKKVKDVLLFCGTHSFEIFLLHEMIFLMWDNSINSLTKRASDFVPANKWRIAEYIACFFITLILSKHAKKVIDKTINIFYPFTAQNRYRF